MKRAITIKSLLKKTFQILNFSGVWEEVFGHPEASGLWLIFGVDKNGKTWFSLKLAEYLSEFEKVLYVSAEEGTGKAFQETAIRTGLDKDNTNLIFEEYCLLDQLDAKLKKRKSPRIVFIDNLTIYNDEFRYGKFRSFCDAHKDKLLIFIAHEERSEPYTAYGKLCKKLAHAIVRVKGLNAFVSGRVPGGTLIIDEQRSKLYHGTN